MSVYLYLKRSNKPKLVSKIRAISKQMDDVDRLQCVDDSPELGDRWQALLRKFLKLSELQDRGCYLQWSTLLQKAAGVPRPEYDFRKFSFREMRQVRGRIRRLLAGGVGAFQDFYYEDDFYYADFHWPQLTFECWTNTLQWAEEIFSNGLKANRQVYLA